MFLFVPPAVTDAELDKVSVRTQSHTRTYTHTHHYSWWAGRWSKSTQSTGERGGCTASPPVKIVQ